MSNLKFRKNTEHWVLFHDDEEIKGFYDHLSFARELNFWWVTLLGKKISNLREFLASFAHKGEGN